MTQYERTALKAVELLRQDQSILARNIWDLTAYETISTKESREKQCPKLAFVSLCQLDLIKGISPQNGEVYQGICTHYMREAAKILKSEPYLINNKSKVWLKIKGHSDAIASRLDPIFALWKNNLINEDNIH